MIMQHVLKRCVRVAATSAVTASLVLSMCPVSAIADQLNAGATVLGADDAPGVGQSESEAPAVSGAGSSSGNDSAAKVEAPETGQSGNSDGSQVTPPETDDAGKSDLELPSDTSEGSTSEGSTSSDEAAADDAGTVAPDVQKSDDGAHEGITLSGSAHIRDIGWKDVQPDEDGILTLGTTGKAKALEAFKLDAADETVSLSYEAHVQNIGWMPAASLGQVAGTTGRALSVEAVKLTLGTAESQEYDIWYRAHVQDIGWLGWANNGQPAGSQGLAKAVEAIQVIVLPKGQQPAGFDASAQPFKFRVLTYAQNIQDVGAVSGYTTTYDKQLRLGTTGMGKRLEAISLAFGAAVDGDISYEAYVQDAGWKSAANGQYAGTVGQRKRLEAVSFSLSGAVSEKYDVWYRAHVSDYGWLGWAKNGERAGSLGFSKSIEAIDVVLLPKGQVPQGYDGAAQAFKAAQVSYSSHIQDIGWVGVAGDSFANKVFTLGTTGKGKHLEAFSFALPGVSTSGSVLYSAHVSDIGWQDQRADGATAGTTGQNRSVQAVKFSLSGELESEYDIYYRAHVANIGWMGWAKNGESAGTVYGGIPVEALQVIIVQKGQIPAEVQNSQGPAFLDGNNLPVTVTTGSNAGGTWSDVAAGQIAGSTGRNLALQGIRMSSQGSGFSGGISYTAHVSNVGWLLTATNGVELKSGANTVQAIKVSLSGDYAKYFDVYYRVYISGYGWMGWALNGAAAGTTGLNKNVEAYQVKLVLKGAPAPGSTDKSFSDQNGFLRPVSARQRAIVAACHVVPSPGPGLCAAWVTNVFQYAGYGYIGGDARDMYWAYCHSSNIDDLQIGMVVAVPSHPGSYAGSIWGHIAIYVGDGLVMENIYGYINTQPLSSWIAHYGKTYTPKWGWLGNIPLN